MDKDKLGNKQLCQSCGIKFFDFKKEIPVCPKCETEIIIKTKPRLGRPPLNKKEKVEKSILENKEKEKITKNTEDEIEINEDINDIISLEDLETENEEISDTDEEIDLISEENNDENFTEITDINIDKDKEENS